MMSCNEPIPLLSFLLQERFDDDVSIVVLLIGIILSPQIAGIRNTMYTFLWQSFG